VGLGEAGVTRTLLATLKARTLATSRGVTEAAWRKRSQSHTTTNKKRKTKNLMDGQHKDMDWTCNRNASESTGPQITMEIGGPWCGQPSDRGRLKAVQAKLAKHHCL